MDTLWHRRPLPTPGGLGLKLGLYLVSANPLGTTPRWTAPTFITHLSPASPSAQRTGSLCPSSPPGAGGECHHPGEAESSLLELRGRVRLQTGQGGQPERQQCHAAWLCAGTRLWSIRAFPTQHGAWTQSFIADVPPPVFLPLLSTLSCVRSLNPH